MRPALWLCMAAFTQAASGDFVSTDYQPYNDGELGHRPHLEFHSSNEYTPLLQVNVWNRDAISSTGSHIFLRHDGNDTSPLASPLILDANDLSAVYLNRSFQNVFGTRVQENFGRKYLTFWAGEKGDGIGDGYGLAFDESYRLAYKVSAQNIRTHSDLHEFAFTGHGSALVTGVDRIQAQAADFPQWPLPDTLEVLDAIFQEIDLETNAVLFHWRALDHINPMDSFEPQGRGWDAYHLNSIEKTEAGNYLLSARHMHSIYLIDGRTGDILWTLGGRRNNFVEHPPAGAVASAQPVLTMGWQHHARFVPGTNETQMTLFDNHVKVTTHGSCDTDCSRGLHIGIDASVSPPTVQLLHEFLHPSRLQAQSQGSVQPLLPAAGDLGNVFIGWGRCPTFTEHSSSGETVLDVQFSPWHSPSIPDALDNYRAYKMDWSATPWWDPVIAPRRDAQGELVVFVSWNGATEVVEWVVRGATSHPTGHQGTVLATSRRTGFETKLTVPETGQRYLWAEALDRRGTVLRSTEVVDLNTTQLPVAASDPYDESDSTFLPIEATSTASPPVPTPSATAPTQAQTVQPSYNPRTAARLSPAAWAFLGTGLGVLVLAILVAGVIWWRRSRNYKRLDADDFALDSDDDLSDRDDVDDEDKMDHDAGTESARDEADVIGLAVDPPFPVVEDRRPLIPKAEEAKPGID